MKPPVSTWMLPEDLRYMATTLVQIRTAVPGLEKTNFALHSDFRWLLVVPTFAWLAGLALYNSGRQKK